MREFAKVPPTFWISNTHRKLKDSCPEAMVVALYLLTSPHSSMTGLYYLPVAYIAHDTGLGLEGAMKGLECACEADFCFYDSEIEMVWVPGMARDQIGVALKSGDNQVKGVQKAFNLMPNIEYKSMFYSLYKDDFHLSLNEDLPPVSFIKFKGACEGLASKEKEKEKEKEKDPPLPPKGRRKEKFNPFDVELPEWLPTELWAEWVDYLKDSGKPIKTAASIKLSIKNLDELRGKGNEPESVIHQSIANGWQGLFELSKSGNEFIDFEGSFDRVINCRKKPETKGEALAHKYYSKAGLGRSSENLCRTAWRGYLKQAYKELGKSFSEGIENG